MWKETIRLLGTSFSEIFNLRDDEAKGRVIFLSCSLLESLYNVFITGIFYTGFLSMYGISITGAGIVTFIPYIANILTVFSSRVLSRFRRRKPILIGVKVFFFFMYIVATTIMPQFVHDSSLRLKWLCVIIFVGYAVYAPFSPGFTVWFYKFYPEDTKRRARYIQLCQIFTSALSTLILLFSGILTDAVADSPIQERLIIGFRYAAFVLVLVEIFVQSRAKEYPVTENEKTRIKDVFCLPMKQRKFLLCMLLMFTWSFVNNLNNGLWNYHILNHLNFSYTLINAMAVSNTAILLATSGVWTKVIRRYSWIRTFGIGCLLCAPTEFLLFMMSPDRTWIYVPATLLQNFCGVGLGLAYANILYMNLPSENQTSYISFNVIGCNLFSFLGLLTGTAISSITGDNTVPFLGMNMYSIQCTNIISGVALICIGILLLKKWRLFSPDADEKCG